MKKTIILSLIMMLAFSSCRSTNETNNNSETASPDVVFSSSGEAVTSASESDISPSESTFSLFDDEEDYENKTVREHDEYISYSLTSEEFDEYKNSFTQAYCSHSTVIALAENGNVITWGSNYSGKIGNGGIDCYEQYYRNDPYYIAEPVTPYCIDFNEKIVSVGVSESIAHAITESGEVFMWGRNDFGETGIEVGNITEPTKINIDREIKKIASGDAAFLFLAKDGEVFRSGIDTSVYERLGDMREYVAYEYNEAVSDKPYGLVVAEPGYEKIDLPFKCKDVSFALMHYAYLSEDGEVYVQGKLLGDYQQMAPYLVHDELYKIDFPEKITSIESGSSAIAALSESGNVYLYGRKESVFFDETYDSEISENVFKKGGLENIVSISCGVYCITSVDASGNAFGFGYDYCGVIDVKNSETDPSAYETITYPRLISDNAVICTNDSRICVVIQKNGEMLIQGYEADSLSNY